MPHRPSVQVSAVLEEELHNVHVALLRCRPKRHVVISLDMSPMLNEELHNVQEALKRCLGQC